MCVHGVALKRALERRGAGVWVCLHHVVLGKLGVHGVHHVGSGVADAVAVGAQHGVRGGGGGVGGGGGDVVDAVV